MKPKHLFLELSVLGMLSFSLFFPLSSFAFGGYGGENLSDAVKVEISACKDLSVKEEKQSCIKNVFDANDIAMPARGGRKHGFAAANLSDEVKAALKACHTENQGDKDAMHACAEAVATANGIELSQGCGGHSGMKFGHGRGMGLGKGLNATLTDDQWKSVRTAMQTCLRDHETREDVFQCIHDAREAVRSSN